MMEFNLTEVYLIHDAIYAEIESHENSLSEIKNPVMIKFVKETLASLKLLRDRINKELEKLEQEDAVYEAKGRHR